MYPLCIATVAYNKPEFIEYQYRSLKKFIKNEFDFIVYDNTVNAQIKKEVYAECKRLEIQVVGVPDNSGGDSTRAGASLDYALNDIRKKLYAYVMLIDSDVFLVDYYDAVGSLYDCDLLGRYWNIEHIFYYTNHFIQLQLFKFPVDKNLSFAPVITDSIQLDCGGALYSYLRDYPEIRHNAIKVIPRNFITVGNIERYQVLNKNKLLLDFFKSECSIFENRSNFSELFQDVFIHLRAGSNWISVDANKQKLRENNLYKLINTLTQ